MFRPKLPNVVAVALLASTLAVITSPVQAAPLDGRIDTSFGTSGFTTTTIGDADQIKHIALDSQGRIIAGGIATIGGVFTFTVARYTVDGVLDTSFGTAGRTTTTIGTGSILTSIALDSQGRIIAGGVAQIGVANRFALARYTSNGVLDTSFGTAGVTTTTIGTGAGGDLTSIALDSQGRIIAGGTATIGGALSFALARYTSNGVLDTSFGTAGLNTTSMGAISRIDSIALDSQGRIIAGGAAQTAIDAAVVFVLARYTADGVLDTSFGTAGFTTTAIGTEDTILSIALDSQGRIIAGGTATIGGALSFALARYTSNGVLDTSFGTAGFTTTTIGTTNGILSIALDSQGRIIAGGTATIRGALSFALARYTSNGVLDTSFGTAGLNTTTIDTGDVIRSIALDSQGRIIAGGGTNVFAVTKFALARYLVTDPAAIAAEAARVAAANAEAARKAKEQKELTEILALIPKIGELTLSLGETTKSLYSTKCVKGKTTKYVKYGTKCPKGYKKK